ncbi:hypothetical protein AC625_03740 [Peribacillus loiseleuriae]|uniref:Uncharacterized protein n=1 Tax=Peribacillus loiseleuriae TaxID=1679170 RepID=A0A0K9GQ07_9BACI|nr:hypothetical protein AC625_03740 [Peribacillus loiseleuriae]
MKETGEAYHDYLPTENELDQLNPLYTYLQLRKILNPLKTLELARNPLLFRWILRKMIKENDSLSIAFRVISFRY